MKEFDPALMQHGLVLLRLSGAKLPTLREIYYHESPLPSQLRYWTAFVNYVERHTGINIAGEKSA